MYIITYTHKNGTGEISVPTHLSEAAFSDVIDFKIAHEEFLENTDSDLFIPAVSSIVKGDLDDIPFEHTGDTDLLKNDNYILAFNEPISIVRLYQHLVNLINSYKPEVKTGSYHFFHKKEEFIVGQKILHNYINNGYTTLTAGEVIEVNELGRIFNNAKATVDKSMSMSNLEFNLTLPQLAMLSRKEGERLPINKKEREVFVNERAGLFQDLGYNVVVDVLFFLRITLVLLLRTAVTQPSLMAKMTLKNSRATKNGVKFKSRLKSKLAGKRRKDGY